MRLGIVRGVGDNALEQLLGRRHLPITESRGPLRTPEPGICVATDERIERNRRSESRDCQRVVATRERGQCVAKPCLRENRRRAGHLSEQIDALERADSGSVGSPSEPARA